MLPGSWKIIHLVQFPDAVWSLSSSLHSGLSGPGGLSRPGALRFRQDPLAPPHILTQEASQPRAEALLFLLSGQVLNGLPSPSAGSPTLVPSPRCIPCRCWFCPRYPEKCLLQGGREQTGGIGKPRLPQVGGVLSIRTFPPSESFSTSVAIPLEAGLAGRGAREPLCSETTPATCQLV